MKYHHVLMDVSKFFFVNAVMYVVFMQIYLIAYSVQKTYALELPFFDVFFAGVTLFVALVVWLSVSSVWQSKSSKPRAMAQLAFFAEIPFVVLVGLLWFVVLSVKDSNLFSIVLLFTGYLILFPGVMFIAQEHLEKN